jgi:hypothetical protein
MNLGIRLEKVWFDNEVIELKIETSDGESLFSNNVYIGHEAISDLIADINVFKDGVYGGIYDIEFGGFGPEYANGAFHARLHFQDGRKIFITVKAQTEYFDFGKKGVAVKNVANEATLYLVSESAFLDEFILELKEFSSSARNDVQLKAIAGLSD